MYRLLIIDDEPIVREGIASNIEWATLGFELIGTCRDGREGMEAIDRHEPDVVLTDICMPFVDGLELASFVAERYPRTRTILLTGYDEFEYAQEAIKLRVHDYLLKPITAAELTQRLVEMRGELDSELNRQAQMERIREQLVESRPILRERFLNRIVRWPTDSADLERRFVSLEIDVQGPCFAVLVCDPDTVDAEEELAALALENIAGDVVGAINGAVSFTTPNETVALLVGARDVAATRALLLECAEIVAERTIQELGITISVGIGAPVADAREIPDSYRSARTALEHRFVLGPNQIISVEQVRGTDDRPHASGFGTLRQRVASALRNGSASVAAEALETLFDRYQAESLTARSCHVETSRLLADLLGALESFGLTYDSIEGADASPFDRIARYKTLPELRQWFLRFLDLVSSHIDAQRIDHSQAKAARAEEYIREHYSDPDLSLAKICRELAVSKSYFSPTFKEHTGMTFVEYVTSVRMERAKELLTNDDLKTYEVAERVGYSDAHYFSLTFRKQTGLSPTEYREQRSA